MKDWDLPSIGLVLIGSSITAAGTIIGATLLGVRFEYTRYLLFTTAVLVVLSAALIIISMKKNAPESP